jgi:FtsZ-binding cell division protein ZapB
MAAVAREADLDSLASLEERITRAVDIVSKLRSEKDALATQVNSLTAERDSAQKEAAAANAQTQKTIQELEELRSERKQVRARIEKLLGQMDLLGTT